MRGVPKKFLKNKKSFLSRLSPEFARNNTSMFCAFPKTLSFTGQDKGESVVLIVRRHPAVFIPQYLLILALLLSPALFFSVLGRDEGFGVLYMFGVGLLFTLIAVTVAVDTFFKWYYSVNIITDQRIVDVDFDNILFHRFSEAQLEKIEDVSHAPVGILSTFFDYGDVYIQTAAAKPEFEFHSVPRARDIQDTLLDLLELKKKGHI
jgi:hypothetical protein